MSFLTLTSSRGVATVTLNRPDKLNALSRALRQQLVHMFGEIDVDDSVHAVILTGAGERAFSAGIDLKELGMQTAGTLDGGDPSEDPVGAIEAFSKPVICAINGVAVTGGLELALSGDILIASTNALFADTHVRVGVMPGWGLSQKLSRLIGIYRAKEMSLSGRFVDASTALAWGMVNRVVEPDLLMQTAQALAAKIAAHDPSMVGRYKDLIDEGYKTTYQEARDHERAIASKFNRCIADIALASASSAIIGR